MLRNNKEMPPLNCPSFQQSGDSLCLGLCPNNGNMETMIFFVLVSIIKRSGERALPQAEVVGRQQNNIDDPETQEIN